MSEEDPDDDLELRREQTRLTFEVHDRLRNATELGDRRWSRVGQLLVLPSFSNPYSWDIVRKGDFSLFRTCWRQDLDVLAFESAEARRRYPTPFVPTIEVVPVPVASEELQGFLEQFSHVRVPVVLKDPLEGLDGAGYELLLGSGFACTRLTWWSELPDEWEPLKPLVTRMFKTFEG